MNNIKKSVNSSSKLAFSDDTYIKLFGKDDDGCYTSITACSPKEYRLFLISDIEKIYVNIGCFKCSVTFKLRNGKEFDIVNLSLKYKEEERFIFFSGPHQMEAKENVMLSLDKIIDSARKNVNLIFPSTKVCGIFPVEYSFEKDNRHNVCESIYHFEILSSVADAIFNYLNARYLSPIIDFLSEESVSINTAPSLNNMED